MASEQLLEGEAEQLTRKAVAMAKQGNIHALRLCLERILPVRKERCISLELRPVTGPQDFPVHFQDITAAVAEGKITPGEGESISNILSSHARIMELVELDRRVAELEAFGREAQTYQSELKRFVEQAGLQGYNECRREDLENEKLAEESAR